MSKHIISFSISLFLLIGCNSGLTEGSQISNSDLEFIQELGLLDVDEEIILIHSQSGSFKDLKTSGNFYSSKRIATYWIDDSERTIDYAYYSDIETIIPVNLSQSLTYASYLEVKRNDNSSFRVYVSGDSSVAWRFFNGALKTWLQLK